MVVRFITSCIIQFADDKRTIVRKVHNKATLRTDNILMLDTSLEVYIISTLQNFKRQSLLRSVQIAR